MMKPDPKAEHRWLQRMLGEWSVEGSCEMGPDKAPETMTGTETMRALGELWIMGEGRGEMPGGGGEARNVITLGYDPVKGRFVGSFISSVMSNLWIYEGSLAGDVLTLDCEGPDFADPTKTCPYQDILEIVADDHRILRSRMKGPDGEWHQIMQAHYRRLG
ncbi:DUF1579 domain-containing protein [Roseococcus sp. SYP-B2431]|uniref:DUF1579 domain-containing protein n=1 Tax=Roseococcus sp. SYP-B2431 TaxID=2496640 RepID=UPI001F0F4D67|nr:DUF1579 domain-containing protein [Roseococcus sp. SYP-B2431]